MKQKMQQRPSLPRRVRALPEMVPWCDDIDVDDYVPYPRAAKRLNAKYEKLRAKK